MPPVGYDAHAKYLTVLLDGLFCPLSKAGAPPVLIGWLRAWKEGREGKERMEGREECDSWWAVEEGKGKREERET